MRAISDGIFLNDDCEVRLRRWADADFGQDISKLWKQSVDYFVDMYFAFSRVALRSLF